MAKEGFNFDKRSAHRIVESTLEVERKQRPENRGSIDEPVLVPFEIERFRLLEQWSYVGTQPFDGISTTANRVFWNGSNWEEDTSITHTIHEEITSIPWSSNISFSDAQYVIAYHRHDRDWWQAIHHLDRLHSAHSPGVVSTTIPAYAVVMASGRAGDTPGHRNYATYQTGDAGAFSLVAQGSIVAVNGPTAVDYGTPEPNGFLEFANEPTQVLYETGLSEGAPGNAAIWGPISGSWTLWPGMPGFRHTGGGVTGRSYFIREFGGVFFAKATEENLGTGSETVEANPMTGRTGNVYDGAGLYPEIEMRIMFPGNDTGLSLNVGVGDVIAYSPLESGTIPAGSPSHHGIAIGTYRDAVQGTMMLIETSDYTSLPRGWSIWTPAADRLVLGRVDSADAVQGNLTGTGGSDVLSGTVGVVIIQRD